MTEDRAEALSLIDECVRAGARLERACHELGLHPRTVQRWREQPQGGCDKRRGPHSSPKQKFSAPERAAVIAIANAPQFATRRRTAGILLPFSLSANDGSEFIPLGSTAHWFLNGLLKRPA